MQSLTLREPVVVDGYGFLGQRTGIRLAPRNQRGWCVRTMHPLLGTYDHEISVAQIRNGAHCLSVAGGAWGGWRLDIVEHLLALRSGMHVDGIVICFPTHGIPYTGHAENFVRAAKPLLEEGPQLSAYTTTRTIPRTYTEDRAGYVEFDPATRGGLVVHVSVDYKKLGGYREFVWDSSKDSFEAIASSRGELRPSLRLVRRAAVEFGWPHKGAFVDARTTPGPQFLREVLEHRVIDALGALSVVTPGGGHLIGRYRCHRAGHGPDTLLVRAIAQGLVEVRNSTKVAA